MLTSTELPKMLVSLYFVAESYRKRLFCSKFGLFVSESSREVEE